MNGPYHSVYLLEGNKSGVLKQQHVKFRSLDQIDAEYVGDENSEDCPWKEVNVNKAASHHKHIYSDKDGVVGDFAA